MSTVFRARDTNNGATVALKLLRVEGNGRHALERFNREVRLLSKLNHPRIAKYISHGRTEHGHPFLVMEWLHGEDLAERLRRGRLSPSDAFTVTNQVAEALAVIHQLGIVHRDIKPSNVFLCKGDLTQVMLLDFGIAQRQSRVRSLTRAGAMIGTPSYMAPEQACGERRVRPSADIFSLGCLLFECLAGNPPFASEHIAGVLAKVLFEEPPSIRTLRPEVSQPFAALLSKMLTKALEHRFRDGAVLLSKLQEIEELGLDSASLIPPAQSADTWLADEQWLCTVVIAAPRGALMGSVTLSTDEVAQDAARCTRLRNALLHMGAQAAWLPDGSLVATLTSASMGNATDQVAVAARAAVWLKEQWPESLVVLATGRAVIRAALPVGEVIDRAMRQLDDLSKRSTATNAPFGIPEAGGAPDATMGVQMDELSADLLGPRFELRKNQGGYSLHGEQATADETRPLLGRPTPCLGREPELHLLETMLAGCIRDSRACAALIKAPPGFGKSRVRHELVRRIQQRGREPEILFGRGDPLRAGSSSSVVGQMLRRLCDLRDGEDRATQQTKLLRRLGRFLDDKQRAATLEFLAELCDVSFAEGCAQLRAARRDPNVMADWLVRSFLTWLRAECTQRPTLIVVEDLHWGDPLSIKLIEEALRELHDLPVMVLALARPEVDQAFPGLWDAYVRQFWLPRLDDQASEALVKLVLGHLVEPQDTLRIVQQAAGNALFLEELIRAAARPTTDAPSDTVLALLQARIGRLDGGARRVLTTASLFGISFRRRGIMAMLGSTCMPEEVDTWLALLVQEEIVSRHPESRFTADVEYGFRHALVCDAAYSLLTDASRRQGHRLAGAFLEAAGEPDAFSVAEHFGNSDEPARAPPWYIAAADRELARNDLDKTWLCTQRGLQYCTAPEHMGILYSLQCTVHFWRYEWLAVCPSGSKALQLLCPGGLRWCTIIGFLLIGTGHTDKPAEFARLVQLCNNVTPSPDARGTYLEAIAWLVIMFVVLGERDAANSYIERIVHLAESLQDDQSSLGWRYLSDAMYKRTLVADPWGAMLAAQTSAEAFHRAGAVQNWIMARVYLSYTQYELGSCAAAEVTLRNALLDGERRGDPMVIKHGRAYLAWMLADRPGAERSDEIATLLVDVVARPEFSDSGNTTAHCALALQSSAAGDLQTAESHATLACRNSVSMPVEHLQALTVLIKIYRQQGQIEAARRSVTEGMVMLSRLGCAGHAEVGFRLAAAQVSHAEGAFEAARDVLRETLRQIEIRGAGISDREVRLGYCAVQTANACARRLAQSWLGQDVALAFGASLDR